MEIKWGPKLNHQRDRIGSKSKPSQRSNWIQKSTIIEIKLGPKVNHHEDQSNWVEQFLLVFSSLTGNFFMCSIIFRFFSYIMLTWWMYWCTHSAVVFLNVRILELIPVYFHALTCRWRKFCSVLHENSTLCVTERFGRQKLTVPRW